MQSIVQKVLIWGSLLTLSGASISWTYAQEENTRQLEIPHIQAESAVLMDVKSGRILFEKKSEKPMRIASLTKIMTALIAIEQGNLADRVRVSALASRKEGSSLYLKEGEVMSLHHLLYGLMLRSGNDAATAIAEHIGGSVEGFAYLMNEKAELLGMSQSHFSNPTGLDESGAHFASAKDLALLTSYALKNPIFQEIVKTKHKKVDHPFESWDYSWMNKNKMLFLFPGADGVKTGYTRLAKRCLVSSATSQGQQLTVITLNDANDWGDHTQLLRYGFQHFPMSPISLNLENSLAQHVIFPPTFSYPLHQDEIHLVKPYVFPHDAQSLAARLGEYGYVHVQLADQKIAKLILDLRSKVPQTKEVNSANHLPPIEKLGQWTAGKMDHMVLLWNQLCTRFQHSLHGLGGSARW